MLNASATRHIPALTAVRAAFIQSPSTSAMTEARGSTAGPVTPVKAVVFGANCVLRTPWRVICFRAAWRAHD